MAKAKSGGRRGSGATGDSVGRKKGFEQTVEQLEQIIGKLESGDLSLEESLKAFEDGVGLVRNAEAILNDAERRVEILLKGPGKNEQEGGGPEVQPFSPADRNAD